MTVQTDPGTRAPDGCTTPGCDRPPATMDGVHGRRCDQHPPATNQRERISVSRTKRRAEEAGWLPPLGWDDESIDDPTAQPDTADGEDHVDELAVAHVLEGIRLQLTGATAHAAVHALAAAGHQPAAIAERTGVHLRQVERLRDRAEPPRPKRQPEAA